MFAVMSTALNCFNDLAIICFCISKDQMSMHELFSLDIGGMDEEDDPYSEQRDHLYSITEHKIDDAISSSGDDADIEDDIEDRMANYEYRRHHAKHSWGENLISVFTFCVNGP